jgi:hypothetical protein
VGNACSDFKEKAVTWLCVLMGKLILLTEPELTIMAMRTPRRAFVMQCGEHVCEGMSKMIDSLLNLSN